MKIKCNWETEGKATAYSNSDQKKKTAFTKLRSKVTCLGTEYHCNLIQHVNKNTQNFTFKACRETAHERLQIQQHIFIKHIVCISNGLCMSSGQSIAHVEMACWNIHEATSERSTIYKA